MIGWIVDILVSSAGSSAPPRPQSREDAQSRFLLRLVWLLIGLAALTGGSLAAMLVPHPTIRAFGVALAVLGSTNVLFGIPRLIELYRFHRSASRRQPSNER